MKCPSCPVVGPACLGESVPRLCHLAETQPAYAHQLRVYAGEAEHVPEPEPRFPYLKAENKARINACPHRDCRLGCQRSLCKLGKGDQWNQVTLEDCWNCLDSNA